MSSLSIETVLVVDDEESVRKTFREWLDSAKLGCRVLTAADAESALVQANQQTIDLAILDWNLGAGNDGLQLLEDLVVFNADIVAILITGFAHQATPLHAMRMGVRDYLDKNQDLDRNTFLDAVRKQLERIRPARRERQLHQELLAFRVAVAKVLPLVETAAALNDPVPLPAAVAELLAFLMQVTTASDGAIVIRHYAETETLFAYDTKGQRFSDLPVPFARSLAGGIVGLGQPAVLSPLTTSGDLTDLQPFEQGHRSLLAIPLAVAPGTQVVIELFDKPTSFTDHDRRLAGAAASLGVVLVRQALAERHSQHVLFDAVSAALAASDVMSRTLAPTPETPPAVLERVQAGLAQHPEAVIASGPTLQLAEAVRSLALRHGPRAVEHCIQLVTSLKNLLDATAGLPEGRP